MHVLPISFAFVELFYFAKLQLRALAKRRESQTRGKVDFAVEVAKFSLNKDPTFFFRVMAFFCSLCPPSNPSEVCWKRSRRVSSDVTGGSG